ncbi:MAG: hypothetical protein Q8865_04870 [Bacillota bacterium]|nr:hypothetical protein [Bacillota bacterium]
MTYNKSTNRLILIFISAFIVLTLLLNAAGYLFDFKYISVVKAVAEVDKYEVRSRLLMDAMDYVGVCKPEDAATVWATGLMHRSAAMQYSVMAKKLRDEYAKQLEKNNPNWVTGVSSPWVDSFKIVDIKNEGGDYLIRLLISTKTSAGSAGDYNAMLTVSKEGDFWRITRLAMDKELSVYTGFGEA